MRAGAGSVSVEWGRFLIVVRRCWVQTVGPDDLYVATVGGFDAVVGCDGAFGDGGRSDGPCSG